MKIIKKMALLGLLWCVPLQAQTDSIVISPYWHTLRNHQLSADGAWASVMKVYEDNNDTIYILNTKSGAKNEIVNLSAPEFVGDFVVGTNKKSSNTLRIIPFKKGKERTTGKLLKHQSLEKRDALITIDTDSVFRLEKLSINTNELLLKQENITDFEINEQQTYGVLYREKGEELTIYGLDLNILKLKELLQLKGSLSHDKVWNTSENKLLVQTKNKELLYLDVENGLGRVISLTKYGEVSGLNVDFSANDKILVSTGIKTDESNEYLEHVDIWYGNDRELGNKMYLTKGNKVLSKKLIYDPETDVWREPEVKDKQELIFIKNPDYVMILDRWKYTDYSHYYPLADIYLKDLKTGEEILVADKVANLNTSFTYALDGKYMAYKQDGEWNWIEVATQKRHFFEDSSIPNHLSNFTLQEWLWSQDCVSAYVVGNQLWKVNLETGEKKALTNFTSTNLELKVLNIKSKNRQFFDFGIASPNSIEGSDLVLLTYNPNTHEYRLYTIDDKEQLVSIYQTSNKISKVNWSADFKTLVFNEENFNLPHRVVVSSTGRTKILLENQQPKELYEWRKQLIHHFKNKQGEDLQGILYYPKNFDVKKKYPMITHIYQTQNKKASEFLIPSLYNGDGFNIALLIDLGYFVYLPDILETEEGSGYSALDCVTRGVNTVSELEPAINKEKLGLIGFSFGALESNFIITQSDLFAAAVSGAATNDLMWDYYSYNYNFSNLMHWRYENNHQFLMGKTFKEVGEKYLQNSPLRYAHKVQTPLLAWTGLEDFNVHWEHTRHFYTALKRYKISHIALFYKDEGHSMSKEINKKDLTLRIIDWFDYYLKEKECVKWITKGVYYNS